MAFKWAFIQALPSILLPLFSGPTNVVITALMALVPLPPYRNRLEQLSKGYHPNFDALSRLRIGAMLHLGKKG